LGLRPNVFPFQEIGKAHAVVVNGLTTRLQLAGLIARLSQVHDKLNEEEGV